MNAMAKRTTAARNATKTPQAFTGEQTADQAADMGGRMTRSDSMGSEPSEEDIRMRAYQRYLERGAGHGQDFDDWLEAERELKNSR
jgi:DUF2934 family protein